MKRILFIIFVTMFIISESIFENRLLAAENELNSDNQRIGVCASLISGYGLSYQYQFENGFSLRAQTGWYIQEYGKYTDHNLLLGDFGMDIQYNLYKSENTRLYAIAGAAYNYYQTGNDSSPVREELVFNIYRTTLMGAGVGYEFNILNPISASLDLGYSYAIKRNQEYNLGNTRRRYDYTYHLVGVGLGINYRF